MHHNRNNNTWRQRTAGGYPSSGNSYADNMNNRNNLFGNRGANAGGRGGPDSFSEQTQRLYEEQNNAQIDALGDKIGALKHIALNIGSEVNQHNSLLDGMDNQMGSVGELMNGALSKLGEMMNAGGSKHMCYLILGIIFLFFALYFLLTWK